MDDRTMPERVALVTGGTRGIGLGIARALAADGWRLVLTGLRDPVQVADVVAELSRPGAEVLYRVADVSDAFARGGLVEFVRARYGTIDALVNNAGRAPRVRADLIDA